MRNSMASELVVFLGPTMQQSEAAGILDAIYLPPAEQGSVVRAVREYLPRAIILIDGSFGTVPAVRHKEILWALAKGIPVFGAASIGAIRAAELAAVGMQGYGFIYRWYLQTPLADDDEVAVAMCPPELGAAPLSEALINIRLTLGRAMLAGLLSAQERRRIEELARRMHFVDRRYACLLAEARSALPRSCAGTLQRLADWLPSSKIDRKREDAVGLLTRLARFRELPGKRQDTQAFRLTEAWAYDLDAAGLWDQDIASILADE
ncbi:TfuA-like protein [Mesorhizobium sp.]|uniref:TfuA-like protein n=1 Tax=Mesorhizobium sp. TaxID=1871066 RepID=UPI00257E73D1|nr:TfuA-like protein [Mesorhizobium sp.]